MSKVCSRAERRGEQSRPILWAAPLHPASNLRETWVDQLAVVELGGRPLIRFGQWEVEADGRFGLLHLGCCCHCCCFPVPEQSSTASWPERRVAFTSIFPQSDVDGLVVAAAFLAVVRGRRRGAERRYGDERHFPWLCHLTCPVRPSVRPGKRHGCRRALSFRAACLEKAISGDGRQVQLASGVSQASFP